MKKLLLIAVALVAMTGLTAKASEVEDTFLPPIQNDVLVKALEQAMVLQAGNRDFMLAQFLANEAKKFKSGDLTMMRSMMQEMSDSQLAAVTGENYKDPTTALVLSILCGTLGVDRFYIGDTGLGIGKLLTFGGLGVWAIIDWFVIQNRTRVKNYKEFTKSYNTSKLFLQ